MVAYWLQCHHFVHAANHARQHSVAPLLCLAIRQYEIDFVTWDARLTISGKGLPLDTNGGGGEQQRADTWSEQSHACKDLLRAERRFTVFHEEQSPC